MNFHNVIVPLNKLLKDLLMDVKRGDIMIHQFYCIIISIVTKCTITVNSLSPENIINI